MKIKTGALAYRLNNIVFMIILILSCTVTMGILRYFQKYLILFGLIIIIFLVILEKKYLTARVQYFWLFFVFYLLIISFFSVYRRESYIYSLSWLFLILAIPYLSINKYLDKYMTFLKIVSIIVAISIFYQLIDNYYVYKYFWYLFEYSKSKAFMLQHTISNDMYSGFYTGIAGEKADAAFVVLVGIMITFSRIFSNKKINILNFLIIVGMYVGLLLTGKRSMFLLSLGLPLLILLVSEVKISKKLKYLLYFSLLAIILLLIILNFVPEATIVFDKLGKARDDDTAMLLRKEYWDLCMKMFRQSPVFGLGPKSFKIYQRIYNADFRIDYAHNIYFEMLGEIGSLGLLSFLCAEGYLWILLIRLVRNQRYLTNNLKSILYFSIAYQAAFLFYGLTGNVMYYIFEQTMFLMSIVSAKFLYKELLMTEKRDINKFGYKIFRKLGDNHAEDFDYSTGL